MILERSSGLVKLQQILSELQTAVTLVPDEQLMNLKRKWSSEPSTATLTCHNFADFQQETTKDSQRQICNTRSAPEFLMNLLTFTNIPFDGRRSTHHKICQQHKTFYIIRASKVVNDFVLFFGKKEGCSLRMNDGNLCDAWRSNNKAIKISHKASREAVNLCFS